MKPTGRNTGNELLEFAEWIRQQRPQTPEEKQVFIAELRRRRAGLSKFFTPEVKEAVKQELMRRERSKDENHVP